MNWLDELRRLIELYRKELGEEVAAFLLSIPIMARLPLGKLARIGENWGNVDYQFNEVTPHPLSDYPGSLRTIFENPHDARIGEDWVEVTLNRHTSRFISRLWLLAYIAILAWWEQHEPEYAEPALPVDPNESLKALYKQIRTAGPGYDMTQAIECLEQLGITGDLPAECTSRVGAPKPAVSVKTLLKIVELQPTSWHSISDAVSFIDSAGDTVRVSFPKKIAVIVGAIHERRRALSLWWSPD